MQIGVETSRAVDNKRIFIVHEDEITRAVLQFMLQDENETHDLGNLQHALSKATEWPPHLLLLDLALVEADPGLLTTVAAALPKVRVLLVAEPGRDAAGQAHVGRGAHGVLTKPLTVETVRRKVDGALGLLKAPIIPLQRLAAGA